MLLTRGDYAGSITILERALALKQDDSILHNNHGIALLRLGRREEADVHLKRAAELKKSAAGQELPPRGDPGLPLAIPCFRFALDGEEGELD